MDFRLSLATLLAASAFCAHAQQAQPAPATMPAVPPNTCVKPELPGPNAPANRMKAFNGEYKAYGDCIQKYVEEGKALANAAAAAVNAAIADYNKLTEEIKAHNEAIKQN